MVCGCGAGAGKISQTPAGAGWGGFKFCRYGAEQTKNFNLRRTLTYRLQQEATQQDREQFDTHFPCISNCWARPRGLQKIAYFNWGSTCRKV